jgi:hypothetical protein
LTRAGSAASIGSIAAGLDFKEVTMASSQWLRAMALASGLMIATVGCKKETANTTGTPGAPAAVTVDQSTPKATAKTFTDAIKAGNVEAAKSVVTGTDDQKKTFEQMVPAQNALIKLVDAANAKFGKDNDIAKTFKDVDHSGDVETADVKEEGDKATLTKKNPGPEDKPLHLVKKDGKWSVDLADMMKEMPQGIDFGKMQKAATDVAADINGGKLKSAGDAMAEFGKKMSGIETPAVPATPTPPGTPAIPAVPGAPK